MRKLACRQARLAVVSLLCLSLSAAALAQTVIYVDADATSGANDGSSWTDAFTDLQDALAAAAAGDEIWVAEGTYKPTDTGDFTISFQMVVGVALYGGFAGTEALRDERDWTVHETILSADLNGDDDPAYPLNDPLRMNSDNSYHVVVGASGATLDGFTVTRGNAVAGSYSDMLHCGGGLRCVGFTELRIQNCVFRENRAFGGGGLYTAMGVLVLENCTFIENEAIDLGGGAYVEEFSEVYAQDCVFERNSATGPATFYWYGNGGGMCIWGPDTYYSLRRCHFIANTALLLSGALDLFHNDAPSLPSDGRIENCVFAGNVVAGSLHPDGRGGGIQLNTMSPAITNCVFYGNSATYLGGGIEVMVNSSPTITNSIFWGNSAPMRPDIDIDFSSSCTVGYNLTGQTLDPVVGFIDGGGNIDADPLFVDPGHWDDAGTPGDESDDVWIDGDYRLQAGSPCIDAADGSAAPAADILGDPRDDDPATPNTGAGTPSYADMGAYEFQSGNPWTPPSSSNGCTPGGQPAAGGAAVILLTLAWLIAPAFCKKGKGR